MFFDLVRRNSRRSRKENGIFFSSLLISIVAFYIVLSLPQQDVMAFLAQMESDAISRLLQMVPLLYGVTLILLFFLVYFASKYQLQRRSHEFGLYLMLGMKRSKLFAMLLAEDLWSSLLSLGIGLPIALLLAEMISLITARLVGIGILGHQSAYSLPAILWTMAGFLGIKFLAFLILSGRIAGMEIGGMLTPLPENARLQRTAFTHKACFLLGFLSLAAAYALAILGFAWTSLLLMGATLALGLAGTFLLFYGMRIVLAALAEKSKAGSRLSVFTFRQLQENVICQPCSMAVSSLLILAALCCFGFGAATALYHTGQKPHVLDYTFQCDYSDVDVEKLLENNGILQRFEDFFPMYVGYIRRGDDGAEPNFEMAEALTALAQMPPSAERDTLLHNLGQMVSPHLISLSGYNHLLAIAGENVIKLDPGEAAVYMDTEFIIDRNLMNQMLSQEPEIHLAGESCRLSGSVQSLSLVVDRAITLSFALIVPDETFGQLTEGEHDTYWDGVLRTEIVEQEGLLQAIMQTNQQLGHTALRYESYLQNVGRQLFYQTAASYITLYLAIIFLLIANTILGVQFLMRQQKAGRRYQSLIRLGSSYQALCGTAKRQACWHFGIPVAVAAASSIFGICSLFAGMLPYGMRHDIPKLSLLAGATVLLLCLAEYIYLTAVTRASRKHLLKLMEPGREE